MIIRLKDVPNHFKVTWWACVYCVGVSNFMVLSAFFIANKGHSPFVIILCAMGSLGTALVIFSKIKKYAQARLVAVLTRDHYVG